jgi:hypothetical protein
MRIMAESQRADRAQQLVDEIRALIPA